MAPKVLIFLILRSEPNNFGRTMKNAKDRATGAIPMPGLNSPSRNDQGVPAPKKILVVDDNIVFLKAISLKLRSAGYDVHLAIDGAAAVSTVRHLIPDLILLDLNFPPDVAHGGGVGWNGLLILSWLRRMNEAQHIPVIAITGENLAKHKDQCRAAGVLDTFYKPVDHEALLSSIRKALNEKDPPKKPLTQSMTAKRVLFVDDESDWRYMGTLYLEECGYEVFTTEDAAGAVKEAARVKPHVIVLDLNLGGDGSTTLLNLLSMAHPHVPILIYTGMDLDEARVSNLRDEGAYDCLRKGTMEELLTAVGRAIQAPRPKPVYVPGQTDRETPPDIRSVLLVEDDVAFGDVVRTFLESHPFCVTRVTDGAEAMRQISSTDFDIIICDMMLPNLNGEQLYASVEQLKPHLCNRFIFMTGHHADPSCDNFIRRVRALMLWKPFHLGDLLAAAEAARKKASSAVAKT